MRKILSILLVLSMILSLALASASCESFTTLGDDERTTKKSSSTVEESEAEEGEETETTNKGESEKATTSKEEESTTEEITTKYSKIEPPVLDYLYNTGYGHKAIGEYLQGALKSAGLNMTLINQEWNTFLENRHNGDYTIARSGWLADFNDPITFLDMWTSDSSGNDVQFGKGAHANLKMYNLDLTVYGYDIKVKNGTWAQTYDVLISTIKSCKDKETRYALMHIAEDMVMDTGCIIPLYYYTDLYMLSDDVEGFYSNPLGYKYFMNTTVNGSSGYINVCLGEEPSTLDPALNSEVGGGTMLSHLFSGLAKWSQDENGKLIIVADVAEELVEPIYNKDGTVTYTYTLKNTKWSNGDIVTAYDFAESWKRAASYELNADYGYMFEVIKGYDTNNLAVRAIDDKTLEVTLISDVTYWNELLAFPTYFPVHSSNRKDMSYSWAYYADQYISNGAYKMTSWKHDYHMILEKNPDYHDADSVTMNKINCYFSDGAYEMLANFKNGDWQLIEDVPADIITVLKKDYASEFKIAGQIGTYYACWNINENLLPGTDLKGVELEKAQEEIRKAISLLLDRRFIAEDIAGYGQVPASSLVAMGITDADGSEFYKNAGYSDAYVGYYDVSTEAMKSNYMKAIEILCKYYKFD